jgi:hypothetical protein
MGENPSCLVGLLSFEERELRMGHKVMKVFDCTDMPEDLCRKFYGLYDRNNDSFIEWTMGDQGDDDTTREVEKWLVENGADPGTFERVLVLYYW